jgi:hypothetical protein
MSFALYVKIGFFLITDPFCDDQLLQSPSRKINYLSERIR